MLSPTPSFDETPSLKTAPTIPSVAKRRSSTLHLENPVSKRWRSGALHPETPVPTTAPPQPRWRPFRRLRGKQPDPSEVSVKRHRLAPAQVLSKKAVIGPLELTKGSHFFHQFHGLLELLKTLSGGVPSAPNPPCGLGIHRAVGFEFVLEVFVNSVTPGALVSHLLALTNTKRLGSTFADNFTCETAQRSKSPLHRHLCPQLCNNAFLSAKELSLPVLELLVRMRPGFVDRDGQHQIDSQHQNRFASLELSLSDNLAFESLQDLLDVTDGGAQGRALGDGVLEVVVL